MLFADLNIATKDLQKLLGAADSDAALLYLYICGGNPPESAVPELKMSLSRYNNAAAMLRQLDLWPEQKKRLVQVGDPPRYTEEDVIRAGKDSEFSGLVGEVEQKLGKHLVTEERKILLGFVRYLGMNPAVVVLLVSYCIARARQKGSSRMPALRSIEKEAYSWAEQGIETMEEASAHIRCLNQRQSRIGKILEILQIRGRNLTPGEEKFVRQWIEWGMGDDMLAQAYERTCVCAGGFSWRYMNAILTRWHEAGYQTVDQIKDTAVKHKGRKVRDLDDDERAALARMMQEG